MRQALRAHLGEDDWEQQALFGRQVIPVPDLASIGHGHVSFQQAKAFLPAESVSSYFKFGFVRNPFDRFVSTCFFLNRRNPGFSGNEAEFMHTAISNIRFRQRVLVSPQYRLLTDDNDTLMMDYVGRYETLQESFDYICRQIGLAPAELSVRNSSRHRHYKCYYDETLKLSVAEFYRKDFELFGYDAEEVVIDSLTGSESRPYTP